MIRKRLSQDFRESWSVSRPKLYERTAARLALAGLASAHSANSVVKFRSLVGLARPVIKSRRETHHPSRKNSVLRRRASRRQIHLPPLRHARLVGSKHK